MFSLQYESVIICLSKQWLGIYFRPSEYPVIIRQALATWIVSGKITVANITDKRLNIPTEITMMLQTSQKATAAQIRQIGVFKIAKTAHLLHQLLPASPNNQKRVHFLEEPSSCMQKQSVETKISTSSTLTQTKVQLSVTPSSQSVQHFSIRPGLHSVATSTDKPAVISSSLSGVTEPCRDNCLCHKCHTRECKQLPLPIERKELCTESTVRKLLPAGFTHDVQSFAAYTPNHYCGAPDMFTADIVADVTDQVSSKKWIEEFCKVSLTMYRTQRTYPKLKEKRLVYKVDYRCQHNTMNRKQKITRTTAAPLHETKILPAQAPLQFL